MNTQSHYAQKESLLFFEINLEQELITASIYFSNSLRQNPLEVENNWQASEVSETFITLNNDGNRRYMLHVYIVCEASL